MARIEVDERVLVAADRMVDAICRLMESKTLYLSAAVLEAGVAKRAYLSACEEEDRRPDSVPPDVSRN